MRAKTLRMACDVGALLDQGHTVTDAAKISGIERAQACRALKAAGINRPRKCRRAAPINGTTKRYAEKPPKPPQMSRIDWLKSQGLWQGAE